MVNCKSIAIVIAMIMIVVAGMGMTSAFLDTKEPIEVIKGEPVTIGDKTVIYNPIWEKYQPIEIVTWLGLGSVKWSGAITEHTETCIEDCHSIITVYIDGDGSLIDDINFYTIINNDTIKQNIINYNIYIQTGTTSDVITDYEYVCTPTGISDLNGTEEQKCEQKEVGNHIVESAVWKSYGLGDVVPAGTYNIKIDGKKHPLKTVDWVIETKGKVISEWATWGSTTLETGLKHYWNFDSAINNNVTNLKNTTANASLVSASLVTPGAVIGKGVITTDDGQYTQTGAFLEPNNWTISFWINFTDRSVSGQNMLGVGPGSGTAGLLVYIQNLPLTGFRILNGSGNANIISVPKTIPNAHKKYNIVLTYNGTDIQTYINGLINVSGTATFNSQAFTETMRLGWGQDVDGGSSVRGIMDEVGMWDRALSSAEVTALYNSGNAVAGLGSGISGSIIELIYPDNNTASTNAINNFNASVTMVSTTAVNISLLINGIINQTTVITGVTNETTWTVTMGHGIYNWSVKACDADNACGFSENRTFTVDTLVPTVVIAYPTGILPSGSYGLNISLNYTISDNNIDACWYNYGGINTTTSCTLNSSVISLYRYNNLTLYANDTVGNLVSARTWWNYTFYEGKQTYNATTYETASETFAIQAGSDSAILYYSGTAYVGTLSGENFIVTLDTPTVSVPTNQTFYWNLTLSGVTYKSAVHNQTVNPIRLQFCNATFNVTYVNFTFKDESTDAYMSAMTDLATWTYHLGSGTTTKTYLFTNLTSNPSYAYCFSPADKTFSSNVVYQYSNTSYPQRYYSIDTTYSNTTTNKLLYLLGSGGLYVSFIAQNPLGNAPISGVTIVVERQFSGIWTQVGQAISDSAGSTTFWLNPNYDHRVTATKTGYDSRTMTVKPSQSVYTIVMGSTSTVTNYTWKGIAWNVGPRDFQLAPNTTYTFFFNVTAKYNNLVKCKMELRNTTDSIFASWEGTATNGGANCIATGDYADNNNNYQLNGYLFLDLGSGYGILKSKDPWLFENYTADNNLNLFDLFKNFNDLEDWGSTHNRQEFSKIVAFFFVMIILLGAFTYFSGYDFAQPGSALLLLWGFVVLGSFAGIFNITGLSFFSFFDKYAVAMITTFLTWGFLINHWRRANG